MKTLFYFAAVMAVLAAFTPLAHAVDGHPAWNTKINSPGRFTVLVAFNKEAVFDRETGLVWERSPGWDYLTWSEAHEHCNVKAVGNRKGWRLPTIQELASLVDPSQSNPNLPIDHPFNDVAEACVFWSATTHSTHTSGAWVLSFCYEDGQLGYNPKDTHRAVWCVRGGQGVDPQ